MKKQILALFLAFILLLTSALVSCGNEPVDTPDADDDKVTDGAEENEEKEEEEEEEDEGEVLPIEGERNDYYKNPEALYAQLSKKEIAFSTRVTDMSGYYDENIMPEELIFIDSAQMLRDRVERMCCAMYQLDGEAPGVPGALTEEWQKFVATVLQQKGYAGLDDAFFAEKVLIPFYKVIPDTSYLIRVERVVKQGNELVIIVQKGRRLPPGAGYLPAVYHYQYLVAVDKKDIEGIEKIKMFVVPLNDARMPKENG